ncbi:MAG: FKBP-type peptidyl-prolyl cis-trans isomerase [Treponema sp.]|jgi:FKBP-type peptidyl-prolyl cis-trans isomerase FkpA|nr:FKBP-type peptidyl-prolyl cis-trans isomerase [Treponema sp.]
MKKNASFFLILGALIVLFGGCKEKNNASSGDAGMTMDKDTSYAIGMYLASQFSIPSVHYDYKSFMDGFRDFTEAEETRFSMEDAIAKIQTAFDQLSAQEDEKNQALGAQNQEEGAAFLEENGRKPGIVTTSSGLQYEVISEGSGVKPAATDTVRVNYEGTLLDGTVFDSSYTRGEPVEFALYGVIPGWTEGLQLMSEGSSYRFFIPADLAYGTQGAGNAVPPNATLIFKVELLSVVR